jgi:cation-transporting ATPase 13A3/4/5
MVACCNIIGVVSGTRINGLLHLKNGVDYINPGEEDQMEIYG